MVLKSLKNNLSKKSSLRSKSLKSVKKSNRENASSDVSRYVKAGRLGGLAPHICRGLECVKLKKEGKLDLKNNSLKSKTKTLKKQNTKNSKSLKSKSTKIRGYKNSKMSKANINKQNAIIRLLKEIF
jgi:hypothetical protein